MKESSAISDEEIISAVLSTGTFEEAAEICGISSRTVRDRMKNPDFVMLYESAKTEIVRSTVAKVNSYTAEAIDTIAEIMRDKENCKPATRLAAAKAILSSAERFSNNLETDEKRIEDYNGVWFWSK